MLEKILGCICYILLFWVFHSICRTSSSYLPGNRCQKYILIKNDMLAIILIAEGVSRDKVVNYYDLNKMSIVGLMSYITLEPINLYILIIRIMDLFELGNVHLGSIYNAIAHGALGILTFVFIIVIVADKS